VNRTLTIVELIESLIAAGVRITRDEAAYLIAYDRHHAIEREDRLVEASGFDSPAALLAGLRRAGYKLEVILLPAGLRRLTLQPKLEPGSPVAELLRACEWWRQLADLIQAEKSELTWRAALAELDRRG